MLILTSAQLFYVPNKMCLRIDFTNQTTSWAHQNKLVSGDHRAIREQKLLLYGQDVEGN